MLAVLGGAFIALGSLFFLAIVSGSALGIGPTRMLGGIGFSLGLILVVVAGAELFTGNNLLAIAWRAALRQVVRHWIIVYVGNVVGALGTVVLVIGSSVDAMGDGALGAQAISAAAAKTSLSFGSVFVRGVLCNALVCLAVWLALGGRSVSDKILAILFPITAFVTIGFEHSIANWFFLPYGVSLDSGSAIPLSAVFRNLAASTLGNRLGGTLLVAAVYWLAYLRSE